MIKRIEKINKYNLQDLCVDRNWFNKGNADEYAQLFKIAETYKFQQTINNRNWEIENMAILIQECTSDDLEIVDIMNAISYNCIDVFYEEV